LEIFFYVPQVYSVNLFANIHIFVIIIDVKMEIFTHILLGAIVGGLFSAKYIGNRALLWGALISLIPHVDMLIMLFLDPLHGLYVLRGISHSLVFIIVITPFVAMAIQRVSKNEHMTLARWTRLVFALLLTHVVYDIFTIRGVGLFEPFFDKRFALCSIADFDMFFVIPLIASILLALQVKQYRHKSIIAWFGIFISILYISFTFLNKLYIQSEFEKKLVQEHIRFDRTEIFPVIGSNFLWNCVAQDRDGFWMCYETNFSKHNFEMNLSMRNDYYIFDFENDSRIQKIKSSTKDYYVVQKMGNGDVFIYDLRMGRMGLNSQAPFMYSYRIKNMHGTIQSLEKIEPSFLKVFFNR